MHPILQWLISHSVHTQNSKQNTHEKKNIRFWFIESSKIPQFRNASFSIYSSVDCLHWVASFFIWFSVLFIIRLSVYVRQIVSVEFKFNLIFLFFSGVEKRK